ncbi:hypothetical protein B7463_g7326, partial [Scytalidium lignicola]
MASSYTLAPPESLYPDLKALEASIQAWGRANGYAFAKRDSNDHRVVFTCAQFGSYQSKGKRSEVHASRQRKGSSKKCNSLQQPDTLLKSSDITNITQKARLNDLGGKMLIQWLLSKLEQRSFCEAYTTSNNNNFVQLFYIDPAVITIYRQYPDILLMDCTYKTNRFHMLLFNICTITGGNKVLQIGLAFLSKETEESYNWALGRLKEVMNKAVRDIYEPRAVWSLTGVAVRIAQGMGLERDGIYLGLPPFETEMRRRIWWQLKMHDFRTAELCGIGKFQDLHTGAESTKWPANINDDQFYPDMASAATESNRLTDATSSPWDPQPHTPGSDTAEIDESFREIEKLLGDKYLRYCDPSRPLHLMAMLMARCCINVVRFMSHHPRRWASREQTPLSERQLVWEICVSLLEQHNMLQSNPQLKQFAWHAPYFQQWHAIIHILDTLRADPLIADADKAWRYIGSTYENNSDMAFDMRRPIHVAVGNLCLKAYSNREAALQNSNTRPLPIPHFIKQLRQQHEADRTKRQEQCAKSGQFEHLVSNCQETAPNNDPRSRSRSRLDNGVNNLSGALGSTYLKQCTKSLSQGLTPGCAPVSLERNPSLFTYGVDGGQVDDIHNANMHLGSMFNQDYNVEDSATYNIT